MYQVYYHETLFIGNVPVQGKKVIDATFETEVEAEHYCRNIVGIQRIGDTFIEHDLNYDEV